MSIILHIGRRHPGVRALYAAIYVVLLLGAVTMVYPFLLMVAGSTKSGVDLKDFAAIPRYLRDDVVLYRKHVEGFFNESLDAMNTAYDSDWPSFDAVVPPADGKAPLVAEWRAFLKEPPLPASYNGCSYIQCAVSRTLPQQLRAFRRELAERYGSKIEQVNRALGCDYAGWNSFFLLPENYLTRVSKPVNSPFALAFQDFKNRRAPDEKYFFCAEGYFKKLYLKTLYSKDIGAYNESHDTHYASYADVHLARIAPEETPKERADWEQFVRNTLNLLWIRAAPEAVPMYRRFLKAKYGSVDVLNRNYGTSYRSFSDIPLVDEPPSGGVALSDWDALISGWKDPDTGELHAVPVEQLRIHSVEFLFRDYLEKKYGSIEMANGALGTSWTGWPDVYPPQCESHYADFLGKRRSLRWEFTTRNYVAVWDYMVLHGRGIMNTVIYCSLAVLFALLVNPLAAYAMSRYRMPSNYKILLFLMLTMAFPPMVTQIPVFLMLREFHLLNTFAALLLPGLANGYSIFLLKGFFDSLPRELYESAQLDGASEWTLFWQITMSLSTPILSVIALQAFAAAYANFMFALLICQDEKMWTLMVWLYQLQQRSGQGVMYASLIIAAIPTFFVFAFCQKVILRGIVVPAEK